MPSNYHTKVFETISTRRSRLCIGLDPDISKVPNRVFTWEKFQFKKKYRIFFQRNNLFNFRGVLCLQATSSDVLSTWL